MEQSQDEDIDIEAIMHTIRQEVLTKKAARTAESAMMPSLKGGRFPTEFYEHLYQAGLEYDRIQTKVYLSQTNVPLIGPVWQWLRRKVHELVVFYVNQLAANQIKVNMHLLQALNILSQELEKMADGEE